MVIQLFQRLPVFNTYTCVENLQLFREIVFDFILKLDSTKEIRTK